MNIEKIVEAGESLLEEVILDVLTREKSGNDRFLSNTEITYRTGIYECRRGQFKNGIVIALLEKLNDKGQIFNKHGIHRWDAWKLTDKEYQKRLND